MFESLSDRLGKIFEGLRGRGALNAADVDAAMREIRRALIEADVSLEVVRAFVEQVRERAVGAEVTRSVTPGQQVVKIVNDELVQVLGSDAVTIDLNAPAPVTLLMVGLQGSGKTTTTAKIAKRLKERSARRCCSLARHAPPRGHAAAQGAGRAGRRRHAADRRHRDPRRDRPPRRARGPAGRV